MESKELERSITPQKREKEKQRLSASEMSISKTHISYKCTGKWAASHFLTHFDASQRHCVQRKQEFEVLSLRAVSAVLSDEHRVVANTLIECRWRDEAHIELRRVARSPLLVVTVLPLAARTPERVSRFRNDWVHQRAIDELRQRTDVT